MKPLREESDLSDPTAARAAQMLGEIRPLARSDVAAARVRRRLQAGERAASFRTSRSALAFAVILGVTASAGATFGIAQLASKSDADSIKQSSRLTNSSGKVDPHEEERGAKTESDRVTGGNKVSESDASRPGPGVNRAASAEPTGDSRTKVGSRTGGAATTNEARSKSKPANTASDAKLVQEAVEALRNDGDAERAGQLLAEYQKRASKGPLAEEALALSIEVALSKKDPKAAELGRQYLAKYPQGRFRELASRAVRK